VRRALTPLYVKHKLGNNLHTAPVTDESGITSVAKAAIFKAAIRRLTEETVQVFKDKRKLPCQNALVKHVHIRTPACHRDTNTSYRTVQADMVIRSGEYSEYKYEYSPT
jgi:hypothetical protein